jgi:hypothetical protein
VLQVITEAIMKLAAKKEARKKPAWISYKASALRCISEYRTLQVVFESSSNIF